MAPAATAAAVAATMPAVSMAPAAAAAAVAVAAAATASTAGHSAAAAVVEGCITISVIEGPVAAGTAHVSARVAVSRVAGALIGIEAGSATDFGRAHVGRIAHALQNADQILALYWAALPEGLISASSVAYHNPHW